jgi:hypothetical protein
MNNYQHTLRNNQKNDGPTNLLLQMAPGLVQSTVDGYILDTAV